MTKSKSTPLSKRRPQKQRTIKKRDSELAPQLLSRKNRNPGDRHVMIALTLASLIAGLLMVINCDRSTNVAAAAKQGAGVSLHGWPMIYLERQFESLPDFLIRSRNYDWPIPAIAGEIRNMNYRNLVIDLICSFAIIFTSYFGVRTFVLRYENWKQNGLNKSQT